MRGEKVERTTVKNKYKSSQSIHTPESNPESFRFRWKIILIQPVGGFLTGRNRHFSIKRSQHDATVAKHLKKMIFYVYFIKVACHKKFTAFNRHIVIGLLTCFY